MISTGTVNSVGNPLMKTWTAIVVQPPSAIGAGVRWRGGSDVFVMPRRVIVRVYGTGSEGGSVSRVADPQQLSKHWRGMQIRYKEREGCLVSGVTSYPVRSFGSTTRDVESQLSCQASPRTKVGKLESVGLLINSIAGKVPTLLLIEVTYSSRHMVRHGAEDVGCCILSS